MNAATVSPRGNTLKNSRLRRGSPSRERNHEMLSFFRDSDLISKNSFQRASPLIRETKSRREARLETTLVRNLEERTRYALADRRGTCGLKLASGGTPGGRVGREAGSSPLLVLIGPTAPGEPRARFVENERNPSVFLYVLEKGGGASVLDLSRARAPSKFPTLPVIKKDRIHKLK